jgi:hypothetical protein
MLAKYQRRRFVLSDGYTSAGYSGRMPMAELADAIVQVRVYPLLCVCSCVSAFYRY